MHLLQNAAVVHVLLAAALFVTGEILVYAKMATRRDAGGALTQHALSASE
jgi:Tfp pilus assembly protein PilN